MAEKKVRYAVVGCGWFAQAAVLPGFENAPHAALAALVSGDPVKREALGKRYGVPAYTYEQYDELLAGGTVDAVYVALPDSMHKEYTVRAARHKIHVLCEKPLALTPAECREMIAACDENAVKLMTAYRLHFEPANLAAIELIRTGTIGEPRFFSSVFTQNVREGNIRLNAALTNGPVGDIGIYCINAARYLFQDDPVEVTAVEAKGEGTRFSQVPEMASVVLRFPKERLATFTCGFGESGVAAYQVVGTAGDLRMDPAYGYDGELRAYLTVAGKTTETTHKRHNQIGAELAYFADCVLNNRSPEPDGYEGLADLLIIDAIQRAAKTGKPVALEPFKVKPRPAAAQEMKLSPVKAPALVNAAPPGGG